MRRSNNPEFGSPPINCSLRLRALKALGTAAANSKLIQDTTTQDRGKRDTFVPGEPHVVIKGRLTSDLRHAPNQELDTPSNSDGPDFVSEPSEHVPATITVVFVTDTDARVPIEGSPGTYRSAMTG